MKRLLATTCSIVLVLGVMISSARAAVPVANRFNISIKVSSLTAGKIYAFNFRLYDAAVGGNELFAEIKSYRVPTSKTVQHLLGSVNLVQPLRAEDFLQQVWLDVSTGVKVFPRIKLGPVPLAIGSQNADLLDGLDSTDFALVDHVHGGPGSGFDADTLDGKHGSFYLDAGNLTSGLLSDSRLSGNVDLLNADQTVTGLKTFQTPKGAAPFAVGERNTAVVTNLNADALDGQHGSDYRNAANLNSGALSTDRYSAYADLGVEGYLGNAAGNLALNNGVLQANLYAEQAQTAGTADALSAAAQTALDVRYGAVPPSPAGSLTGYTTITVDATSGQYTSITIGADGLPVISCYDWTSSAIKVLHCGNASCSSGNTATTFLSGGIVGWYTSITVGADGMPIISYYDRTKGDLKVLHCGNAACTASTATTVDSTGDVGLYTSITIGADGLPVMSYYDYTNGDLKVLHCGNTACTASNTATAVDSSGFVGEYTSITVGADGLPVISYYDRDNKFDLKVLHCGNAACTSGNTAATVDSTGNVGAYTSITIGADGLPVISYLDQTNIALKVLHCGNAACTAGNTATTVASTGDVGEYTSITVGADGLPVISYYDYTNNDLKVLHCGNTVCTASTAATVDSTGDVGNYSSITIGADGLPVISYYDSTNSDLKVAHQFFKPLGRR